MKLPGSRLLNDVFFVAKRDKKIVLLPLVLFLLALAGVLIFLTISGPLAPFIYPLF